MEAGARKKKVLRRIGAMIAAELLLAVLAVWLFDPFYQYHEPFFGLEAVLNDRDNQMPGTIRNFSYDSVLAGSSVAENFDGSFLEEAYGCQILKIIRASGSMADLLYYLEMAQEEHELKNVFWCLDLFAMDADTEVSLYGDEIPRYLHTRTRLDDIPYLCNKEILFRTIPSMLAYGMEGRNTGGNAYNWSRGKEFGPARAMQAYDRGGITPEMVKEPRDYTDRIPLIRENIAMLEEQIQAHPQIRYRFLFPPYSLLWWDCAYVNGELEERFFILNETVAMLLNHENAEIYFFQDEESIVCDLNYYMDMIHYGPEINQYMLEQMRKGENRVTADNWEEVFLGMEDMVERITRERIFEYYKVIGQGGKKFVEFPSGL